MVFVLYLYILLFLIAEEVFLIETSFCVHFLNKKDENVLYFAELTIVTSDIHHTHCSISLLIRSYITLS